MNTHGFHYAATQTVANHNYWSSLFQNASTLAAAIRSGIITKAMANNMHSGIVMAFGLS